MPAHGRASERLQALVRGGRSHPSMGAGGGSATRTTASSARNTPTHSGLWCGARRVVAVEPGAVWVDGGRKAEAEAQSLGIPLEFVRPDGVDVATLYGASLSLIRPDQHVAWRGHAVPADALALVSHLDNMRESVRMQSSATDGRWLQGSVDALFDRVPDASPAQPEANCQSSQTPHHDRLSC